MHTRADTHTRTHAHTYTQTHKHTHTNTHKHTNKHTHKHKHTNTNTQTRMKTPVPRSLAPYPEKASPVTNYVRFNPQCIHIVPPSLRPACLPPSLPTYVRFNPQCIHMLSRALAAAPPAPPCHICTVAPRLVADSGRQAVWCCGWTRAISMSSQALRGTV